MPTALSFPPTLPDRPAGFVRGASCDLPTAAGRFRLHAVVDARGREHAALSLGALDPGTPVLVRLHSECLSGDAFGSLKCDCGPQLHRALQHLAEAGAGVLLYLRQEGRGIGLVDKVRAYALQDQGADTVEANRRLGLPDDARDYAAAADLLRALGVQRVRLLTHNPAKVQGLQAAGITVVERLPLRAGSHPGNQGYLRTKTLRMGHWPDLLDGALRPGRRQTVEDA